MLKQVDDRGNVRTDKSGSERPFGLPDKIGYMFGDFGNEIGRAHV